jgi:hypothetical protein
VVIDSISVRRSLGYRATRKEQKQGRSRGRNQENFDYDDDGYEAFVALMWTQPGIDLKKIHAERVWRSGEVFPAILAQLVESNGRLYINLYEGKTRKTYAADNRHSWRRNGAVIDSSAFQAIKLGVDPEAALSPDSYPASFEAALGPAHNRVAAVGRAFVRTSVGSPGCPYWRNN